MKLIDFIGSEKTTNAVVQKVSRKGIAVSPKESCDKPPGCGSCTACGPVTESKHTIFCPVPHPSDYSIGQCVRTTFFSIHEALAAFIVFGMPLCCALAAYFIYSVFFSAGMESLGAILAAVSALFGSFLLIYGIEKISRKFFGVSVEIDTHQP